MADQEFTTMRHVHCKACGEAVEVEDTYDPEHGYFAGGVIADHECVRLLVRSTDEIEVL
jgi:hypothetical protein